ncbi:hypothetical protein U9R90_28595 [Streptomyces sp. E11-3]|uniref:hypothetical protein n=1 Tax=Streptomyces sp. E11-3 TaxID=3110112 RepID=UPI00397EA5AF
MWCHTCKSEQPHRRLNAEEEERLKDRLAKGHVREYVICDAPGCWHVRTGFSQCAGTGGRHIRLRPDDLD